MCSLANTLICSMHIQHEIWTMNMHIQHGICHNNASSRHAIMKDVTLVGHENRGLISMINMHFDCVRRCTSRRNTESYGVRTVTRKEPNHQASSGRTWTSVTFHVLLRLTAQIWNKSSTKLSLSTLASSSSSCGWTF